MTHQYESEILNKLMERDGFNIPSSVPPYEAEIKAYLINQVKQAYPKLTDYEAEWLLYNYTKHLPADFPISSVSNVTEASFENVVPFAYQSAILKGNTLVNLVDDGVDDASDITKFSHNFTGGGGTFEQVADGVKATATQDGTFLIVGYDIGSQQKKMMTIGKKYYGVADVTVHKLTNSDSCKVIFRTMFGLRESNSLTNGRGLVQSVFTHESDDGNLGWLAVGTDGQKAVVGDSFTIHSMSIYEITEEETNLSYEELANKYPVKCDGMTSCKMPVLTTTGKNLIQQITFKTSGDRNISNETIKVTKGVTYTLSFSSGIINTALSLTRDNKTIPAIPTEHESVVQNLAVFSNYNSVTFTAVESGEFYLHFRGNVAGTKESLSNSNIQLEEGSTATSYEPYKTNILTTPEDVVLRGIGDVKDELNISTGEKVERIGEINTSSLNESHFIGYALEPSGLYRMAINVESLNDNGLIECDKLPVVPFMDSWDLPYECITIYNGGILLYLKDTPTIESFVNKAIGLDLIIQYVKLQNSVKTVDLKTINENGETVYFMPLEGTMNVQSSGEIIQPTFDMSVPVEATTQNLASFIDLEMEE